jgi:3-oxoacyl-[acyl-carrier-protein] synthase-3
MAVLAARDALRAGRVAPEDIGYVVHTYLYHQGFDIWSPAHYIAQAAGALGGLPVNVQQTCNGGALALDLAARWLAATPDASAALVTAADRFSRPGFDRWASDDEAVYGDSGAAVVLGRRGGGDDLFDLLALDMAADPSFEVQLRGDDKFGPVPLWHSTPVSLVRPNNVFRASPQAAQLGKSGVEKLGATMHRSLAKAGVTPQDIRCVAIPRLIRQMRENVFKPGIGLLLGTQPEYLECDTGCLGPAEYLVNLADLATALDPGEVGMLIQGGGGFTFSCTIVRRSVN